MTLNVEELETLPVGAQVRDSDEDTWTKQHDGTWTAEGIGGYYSDWDSNRLVDWYGGVHLTVPAVEAKGTAEPEVVVEGVWIVWSSVTKESINGIFPADAEINALRMVNRDGYGHAEFQPFGEVSY